MLKLLQELFIVNSYISYDLYSVDLSLHSVTDLHATMCNFATSQLQGLWFNTKLKLLYMQIFVCSLILFWVLWFLPDIEQHVLRWACYTNLPLGGNEYMKEYAFGAL